MKHKIIVGMPFALITVCLFIMYGTNIGVPGIAQYWSDFELLDMQWFYSADTVTIMLQNIGADGIRHYLYYFVVDFVFIVLLFLVQLQISKTVSEKNQKICRFLVAFAVALSVLDLLEDILLSLTITDKLPVGVITFTSCITALKFFALFLWCGILLINTLYNKFAER